MAKNKISQNYFLSDSDSASQSILEQSQPSECNGASRGETEERHDAGETENADCGARVDLGEKENIGDDDANRVPQVEEIRGEKEKPPRSSNGNVDELQPIKVRTINNFMQSKFE